MVLTSETRQFRHDSLWNPIRQHKHTAAWVPDNSEPHRRVDSAELGFALRVVLAGPTESSKSSTQSSSVCMSFSDVVPLLLLPSSRSSTTGSGLIVRSWSGPAKSNCKGSSTTDGVVFEGGVVVDSLIGRWLFGSIPRLRSFLLMWVFQ